MTITELRNKRAKLWNTMEGYLDTHRNDLGVLSTEDDAAYAKMERDLDSLTNEIKRMERRDAIEAELNKPVNSPITETPERAASMKPTSLAVRPTPTGRTLTATCAARFSCITCCPRAWTRTAAFLCRRILSAAS